VPRATGRPAPLQTPFPNPRGPRLFQKRLAPRGKRREPKSTGRWICVARRQLRTGTKAKPMHSAARCLLDTAVGHNRTQTHAELPVSHRLIRPHSTRRPFACAPRHVLRAAPRQLCAVREPASIADGRQRTRSMRHTERTPRPARPGRALPALRGARARREARESCSRAIALPWRSAGVCGRQLTVRGEQHSGKAARGGRACPPARARSECVARSVLTLPALRSFNAGLALPRLKCAHFDVGLRVNDSNELTM
jgi:hypothetical protein